MRLIAEDIAELYRTELSGNKARLEDPPSFLGDSRILTPPVASFKPSERAISACMLS
jgi:hypothetical protein